MITVEESKGQDDSASIDNSIDALRLNSDMNMITGDSVPPTTEFMAFNNEFDNFTRNDNRLKRKITPGAASMKTYLPYQDESVEMVGVDVTGMSEKGN